jgi:ribosomal protein L11 methyltransferase
MTRDGKRATRRWDALTLKLASADVDEICGRLGPITDGIECLALPTGDTRVKVFLRPSEADGARAFADGVLQAYGLDPERCDPRIETVEDGHWVERYQQTLHPIDIGTGFTVLPTAVGTAGAGRVGIQLVPGRAFGTGEHPTTQMCTAQLEQRVEPGSRWLDVGCGTAILSIVASQTGAGHVLALDNDPDAADVANEVLACNGMTEGVEVVCGTLGSLPPGTFDGLVANISAPFFSDFGTDLAARITPGGVLVASGFIVDHAGDVEGALQTAGLSIVHRQSQGDWALRIAKRPA